MINQCQKVIKNYEKLEIKSCKITSKLMNVKLEKQKLMKELKRSKDNNDRIRKRLRAYYNEV